MNITKDISPLTEFKRDSARMIAQIKETGRPQILTVNGKPSVVVMDAAAEFRGYAADITRTIPVSGTYTREQRQLYQLVRDAQDAAERYSKPGMRVRAAADSSVALRARGLAALGLIESVEATFDPPWSVNCSANPAPCRQSNLWMIHGITHGIGLAVHDPMQGAGPDATFQEGDAFTIEPGIYVSTRALDVLPDTPKNRAFIAKVRATVLKYQNTGVRIEDDYVGQRSRAHFTRASRDG